MMQEYYERVSPTFFCFCFKNQLLAVSHTLTYATRMNWIVHKQTRKVLNKFYLWLFESLICSMPKIDLFLTMKRQIFTLIVLPQIERNSWKTQKKIIHKIISIIRLQNKQLFVHTPQKIQEFNFCLALGNKITKNALKYTSGFFLLFKLTNFKLIVFFFCFFLFRIKLNPLAIE